MSLKKPIKKGIKMSHELKIRVWDKMNNQFHYTDPLSTFVELRIHNGKITVTPKVIFQSKIGKEVTEISDGPDNYVIQLSSGCSDKNGREIYDGDAIKYHGKVGIVEFFAGAFRCNWPDQTDSEVGTMVTSEMELVGVKNL